jgi:hypothetical protein
VKEGLTLATKTSWELIESEPMLAGLNRQMLNGEKISLARMQFEPGTKDYHRGQDAADPGRRGDHSR